MTTTKRRPTHAEVSLLADLTNLYAGARALVADAKERDMPATARQARHLARQLDAARTCLVQEGEDYLTTAEAVLDAAADRLTAHAVYIGRNVARAPQHRRGGVA